MDLQRIAQEFGQTEDDINDKFFKLNCSKSRLIEVLKGQKFSQWCEIDDYALRQYSEGPYYNLLLETKGAEDIARRKKFLGL